MSTGPILLKMICRIVPFLMSHVMEDTLHPLKGFSPYPFTELDQFDESILLFASNITKFRKMSPGN